MPLCGNETEFTLTNIVSYMSEWILIVNEIYSNSLKQKVQEAQRRKEAERKAAIEKLEKENTLAAIISNL